MKLSHLDTFIAIRAIFLVSGCLRVGIPLSILFLPTPSMHGDDITALQGALGFSPARLDGFFGRDTYRAVRAFQRHAGMTVDGKVGHYTINVLR